MKIKSISIRSFGNLLRWNSGELKDNMTLIYGRNESGKSTITEFIRSTLFPLGGKKATYPLSSKNDSGSIEIVMDNGERRKLIREQKKVKEESGKRTVSEEFPNMDPATYRALYGLDLEQLTENKVISSGDFRGKFLTIPGGENIPEVSKEIDGRLEELMSPGKMSDTREIGACLKEIDSINNEISEIESKLDEYDSLCQEREALRDTVREKKKLMDLSGNERAKRRLIKSQSANLAHLEELETESLRLSDYESFNPEDKLRMDALGKEIEELKNEIPSDNSLKNANAVLSKYDDLEKICSESSKYLSEKETVSRLGIEINSIKSEISDIETDTGWSSEEASKVKNGQYIVSKAERVLQRRNGSNFGKKEYMLFGIGIIGIAVAALGFAFLKNYMVCAAGAAVALIGFVIPFIIVSRRKKNPLNWEDWIANEGYPEGITPERAIILAENLRKLCDLNEKLRKYELERQSLTASTSLFERTLSPVARSFGLRGSTEENIGELRAMMNDAVTAKAENERIGKTKEKLKADTDERNRLVKKWGSEDKFNEAHERKQRLTDVKKEIETLRTSIESTTGLSIQELKAFIENDVPDTEDLKDDSEQCNQRIGEITQIMSGLMDDDEYGKLQTEKMNAETRLKELIREWAVYSVAQTIIRDSCNRFYSDLQPTVVTNANRYLSLMTDGRYQLDNDPRDEEIYVRDNTTRKNSSQWSSGLGDQIYLSVKMALAEEITAEKMPMIFDDVLVRFDDDRKQGACKAIYEFSRKNQVIMFTCDRVVCNYMRLEGEINEITLG